MALHLDGIDGILSHGDSNFEVTVKDNRDAIIIIFKDIGGAGKAANTLHVGQFFMLAMNINRHPASAGFRGVVAVSFIDGSLFSEGSDAA